MDNREIDRLIAYKVMGYLVATEKRPNGDSFILNGRIAKQPVPRYSTNIQYAWEVVDKLKKQNIVEIAIEAEFVECRLLTEFEYNLERLFIALAAEAETAPMAICLVALKSVGIEVSP